MPYINIPSINTSWIFALWFHLLTQLDERHTHARLHTIFILSINFMNTLCFCLWAVPCYVFNFRYYRYLDGMRFMNIYIITVIKSIPNACNLHIIIIQFSYKPLYHNFHVYLLSFYRNEEFKSLISHSVMGYNWWKYKFDY